MPFEFANQSKTPVAADAPKAKSSFSYGEDNPGEITAPKPDPILKSPSMLEFFVPPLAALNTAGRAFKREEAAAAEPLLNMLSRFDSDPNNDNHAPLFESMVSGIKGEPSKLDKSGFRPAEMGDVFRKGFDIAREKGVNVPEGLSEPLSAGAGLLSTFALPSGLIMNAMGNAGKKTAAATDAIEQGAKRLAGTRDFLNVFKDMREMKGMVPQATAEIMSRGSGVPKDVLLYAFEHPEVLNKANAAPERAQAIGSSVAKKVIEATSKNPAAFGVDEKVPMEIAQSMIDNFDTLINDSGKSLGKLKKTYGKEGRRVAVGELEAGINKLLKDKNYLDRKGNILEAHADNPNALYLQDLRDTLQKFGKKKFGLLNLDDLEGFKEIVRQKAYKRATPDTNGFMRPDPEIERFGQQIYGTITNAIRNKYPEPLAEAYAKYSDLADSRGRLTRKFGTAEKLAGFLRRLDRKNPEQMQEFAELVTTVPDGDRFLQDATRFLDQKANSLEGVFPWLNERSHAKIGSEVERLMKKDYFSNDFGLDEKVALEKLSKMLGVNLTQEYLNHYVAKTFSKKANLIKSGFGALIGAGGGAATRGPMGMVPGALLGWMMTDPASQGKMIENFSKIKSSGATRAGMEALAKARPAMARKGSMMLSQVMGDDEE